MTFAHPSGLALALFGLGLVTALAWAATARRAAGAHAYTNLAFARAALRPSPWPAAALGTAFLLGSSAVLTALAGPHFTTRVPAKNATVILCIDTSGSMRALDVEPTRAEAARSAARAFVDAVPDGTRIGVVAFSSSAAVIAPPTADLDAARDALGRLPPPDGGTAIGDALALATQQLPQNGRRFIVLLTDGVNNLGVEPQDAARAAAARGVVIDTVGVGSSDSGQLIPGTSDPAELDADALRELAASTGGGYAEARDAGTLRETFRHLALGTVWERRRVDGSLAFAVGGGGLLIAALLGGLAAGRFP